MIRTWRDTAGYDTAAKAWCHEMGNVILLCNNSSHWILIYDPVVGDNEDREVEEIASFKYTDVRDEQLRDLYRLALGRMVAEALRR